MACQVPCVVTRTGGLAEIVEDGTTGYIVPPANPDALAEGIIRVLEDDERRREMGAAGKRRVAECFTWERSVETLVKYYEQLQS